MGIERDMNKFEQQKIREQEIRKTAHEIAEIFKGRHFSCFEIEQALHEIESIVRHNAYL